MNRMEGNNPDGSNPRPQWDDLPVVVPHEPTVPSRPGTKLPPTVLPEIENPARKENPAPNEVDEWVKHYREQLNNPDKPN